MSDDPQLPALPTSYGLNWNVVFLCGPAAVLTLPLRSHTGRHFAGSAVLGGALFLAAFGLVAHDPDAWLAFLPFLAGAWVNRLHGFRAWLAGDLTHTWSTGHPWFARQLFRFRSDFRAKLVGEPLVGLALCLLLTPLSQGLGAVYLVAGLFAAGSTLTVELDERRAAERLVDARLEAEALARRVRPRHHH